MTKHQHLHQMCTALIRAAAGICILALLLAGGCRNAERPRNAPNLGDGDLSQHTGEFKLDLGYGSFVRFEVVEMDSCEYVAYGINDSFRGVVHRGRCRMCAARSARQTEEDEEGRGW